MSTPVPATSPRASDAERAAVAERLHRALAAGRLDLVETDERVTAAYAARHRHELVPLLADLPDGDATLAAAPSWAELWILAVWRVWSTVLGRTTERPTPRRLRAARLVVALVVLWFVVCAVVGAVVVGA